MKCFLFSSSNGFTTFDNLKLTLLLQLPLQHFSLFSKGVYIYRQSGEGVDVCADAEIQAVPAHIFLVLWHFLSMYLIQILVCSYFHSLGCSLSFKVCTKIAHNS